MSEAIEILEISEICLILGIVLIILNFVIIGLILFGFGFFMHSVELGHINI
ncbi:Uncharacterised protein [uncultured archaeon]|nr:Uncharacterised protein [uncultured archaeon]